MQNLKFKRIRGFIVTVLLVSLFLTFSSLSMAAEGDGDIQKIVLQTPPTVGALPIIWMKESGIFAGELEIDIRISPDHQRALSLISQKEIDMMVTGVNVGAKAFNKGIGLRLVNTNIWGIDYLLTSGFKADSWAELKGKTISLPLKGGPLDFLARYFLIENGVAPEEVEYVYMPSNNGAKTFQLGRVDSIILPEPMVTITMNSYDDSYLSFDIQEEWAKLHNGEDRIPFVGLFVRGDFAEDNRELVEKFNEYYKQGVDWVHGNPAEAAELGAEYFGQPAPVIQASFNRINLNYYPEAESYQLIELYFSEIMKMYPEMIGGKLPNGLFYF